MTQENKKKVLYFVIALSILPVFLSLNIERFANPDSYTLMLMASSIIGLVSAILLFWQYVLGIRFLTSRIVGDLISVNSLHQNIGKYLFLFLLLHPILGILGYGFDLLYLASFNLKTGFDISIALGKTAFGIFGFIWIISAVYRSKLSYRLWKFLHFLTYLILPFVFLHATRLGILVNGNKLMNFYFNLLFAIFVIATVIRIAGQFGFMKKRFKLIEIKKLSWDVNEYVFEAKNETIKLNPGQFIYIQPSFIGENHPFTVAEFDESKKIISLAVKATGKFTKDLTNLTVGSEVLLDGPFGNFTKEAYVTSKPIVLIAGGIGITPFIELIKRAKNISSDIYLFNAVKTDNDICFGDLINSNLSNVVHVFSNQETETSVKHEKGFVTKDLLKKYLGEDLTRFEYFVCGPAVMMNIVEKFLVEEEVRRENLHMERFSL